MYILCCCIVITGVIGVVHTQHFLLLIQEERYCCYATYYSACSSFLFTLYYVCTEMVIDTRCHNEKVTPTQYDYLVCASRSWPITSFTIHCAVALSYPVLSQLISDYCKLNSTIVRAAAGRRNATVKSLLWPTTGDVYD